MYYYTAVVDRKVFSMLSTTENALKHDTILSENQAHCFIIFYIVPLSTKSALNYHLYKILMTETML
jgi:hypothetical protein